MYFISGTNLFVTLFDIYFQTPLFASASLLSIFPSEADKRLNSPAHTELSDGSILNTVWLFLFYSEFN